MIVCFHKHAIEHRFCSECGTQPFALGKMPDGSPMAGINLRCVEEVDLGQLVQQAYETFGDEARRHKIDYRLTINESPVIVSDGDRLLQIVGNLLANAFRAVPDGGRVEVGLAQSAGDVHVTVTDSGPGIAAHEQERLFRPFVSDAGGTGLGLTIARELSLALGGRIDLDSEPGRGSRFELVLPFG